MSKPITVFKAGDRVAERPKNSLVPAMRKESQEIARANSSQRYGTVVSCVTRMNSRNQQIKYCEVLWDGMKSPSLHSHHRLCLVTEHQELVNDYIGSIGA
jgi:hypothetical protein